MPPLKQFYVFCDNSSLNRHGVQHITMFQTLAWEFSFYLCVFCAVVFASSFVSTGIISNNISTNMSKKYCLVRFVDDNILYVVPTNKMSPIEKNLMWAPYKGLGYYEAIPLEYSNSRPLLDKKKKAEHEKMRNKAHEKCTNEKKYSVNDYDDSVIDPKVRLSSSEQIVNETIEKKYLEDDDDSIMDPDFLPSPSVQIRNELIENEASGEEADDSLINPDMEKSSSGIEHFRNKTIDNELDKYDSVMNADHGQIPSNFKPCSYPVEQIRYENSVPVPTTFPAPDMDFRALKVFKSSKQIKTKQHFCKYCSKLQTKFARHLENKHTSEDAVSEFLKLPKKDIHRSKLIDRIRKEGDFLYNTQKGCNMEGNLIVVRCPSASKQRTANHFKPCGNCGGMYSYCSLTTHYRKCEQDRVKGVKDVILSSRQKSLHISSKANDILRDKILPHLRDDKITELIISNERIILFGNRLCQKYRSQHLHKMIRAKLRCVATFLLTYKGVSSSPQIKLEQIFDPSNYENCILSINEMSGLNQETGRYKSPATAFAIGSYLKKISFYLISEYIKQKNKTRQEEVKDFHLLLQEGLAHDQ